MSNLPTDKYTIFMVNTDLMPKNQYLDLINANFTVFTDTLGEYGADPHLAFDIDDACKSHEKFLEQVEKMNERDYDKEVERLSEMGAEGV